MNGNKNEEDLQKPSTQLPELLSLYRTVLIWLFIWTLLVVALISAVLIIMEISNDTSNIEFRIPILGLVVMAGSLGALFSALTRLYTLNELPAAIIWHSLERTKNSYIIVFCLVPPIVGIIGSAFFYVFMQADMLSSPMFVDFSCNKPDKEKVFAGLLSYSPCHPKEYAKAIIWGFVSGFSERLVPDTLARLEKSNNSK